MISIGSQTAELERLIEQAGRITIAEPLEKTDKTTLRELLEVIRKMDRRVTALEEELARVNQ